MKPQFTTFQKIMTTLFVVMETAVMISDVIRLYFRSDDGSGGYYYAVNLGLSVILLAVFLLLIIDPKICVSAEDADKPEELLPLISASRTYMCFIAVDIAAIFAFVMFASKYISNPALWIVIGGVAMFVVGAIKYVTDSRKIGILDLYDDEQTADAKGEPSDEAKQESGPAETGTDTEEQVSDETVQPSSEEGAVSEESGEDDKPSAEAEKEAVTKEVQAEERPSEEVHNEQETEKAAQIQPETSEPNKTDEPDGSKKKRSKKKK